MEGVHPLAHPPVVVTKTKEGEGTMIGRRKGTVEMKRNRKEKLGDRQAAVGEASHCAGVVEEI